MYEEIFADFPRLRTSRVDMRAVCGDDVAMVYAFNGSSVTLQYVARDPYTALTEAEEKVQEFVESIDQKNGLWWTFILRETGQSMGYGGLFDLDAGNGSAEIGYGLLPEFWGHGHITEIVGEMVRFGFAEMDLSLIHALVVPGNVASEKVLLRHGFERGEVLTDHSQARGESFDMGRFEKRNV